MTTLDYRTIAATRNADESALGLKPNTTRNRDAMHAVAIIDAAHNANVYVNASPNVAVYRSYVVVRCYLCGQAVSNGGWQFEHVNDDGHGLAGNELEKAIISGSQDAGCINFSCGTCNSAKNAERAFKARLAKVG